VLLSDIDILPPHIRLLTLLDLTRDSRVRTLLMEVISQISDFDLRIHGKYYPIQEHLLRPQSVIRPVIDINSSEQCLVA
jgi:hypothetical protein